MFNGNSDLLNIPFCLLSLRPSNWATERERRAKGKYFVERREIT